MVPCLDVLTGAGFPGVGREGIDLGVRDVRVGTTIDVGGTKHEALKHLALELQPAILVASGSGTWWVIHLGLSSEMH
jgi:hypothetical protein